MSILRIGNHGPLIVASNYWDSDLAARGLYYLSTNAGCFRLLLPRQLESHVADLAAGKLAVVSRGPWPDGRADDALEVMLDDGTDSPFALHCGPGSYDRVPADADAAGQWLFSVWLRPRRGKGPHKALERPAYYRRVGRLPWLKPWAPPA